MAFGSSSPSWSPHAAGMKSLQEGFGIGKGMPFLGRALGIGFAAYSAFSGYREGGVVGAAKELGSYAIGNYLFGAAIGNPVGQAVLGTAAVVGGGLYARYKASEIGASRYRKDVRLEMGTPVVDPFGNGATMRQRSLQALSNSRLNGMTALGNEASLLFRTY